MTLKIKILCTLFVFLYPVTSQGQNTEKITELSGKYIGQKIPLVAEPFLDGMISTFGSPQMCGAFLKNGSEFYYNALHNDSWTIFVTKELNGKWQTPNPISFTSKTGDVTDRDFTVTPDGTKIVFGSDRSKSVSGRNGLDIFVSERNAAGDWSEPKSISPAVNSDLNENYPSAAANGNLYFFSRRPDGFGGSDIYMSKFINGEYLKPKNLGNKINSSKSDWDSYIAPDESYIIFSSQSRDDTVGMQDLYISFKQNDGSWSQAKNMGRKVNSTNDEICPSVSNDGKIFFFTTRRRGAADIYWMDTKIINDLKPDNIK